MWNRNKESVAVKEHVELAKAEEFLPVGPTRKRLEVYVCGLSFDDHLCSRPEIEDEDEWREEDVEYSYLPCLSVLAPRMCRDTQPNPKGEEEVDEEKPFTRISICKGSLASHGSFVVAEQAVDSILN